ncbi:MAG: Ig-like domain repeat protein, partial [Methanobrevibacter sp.]|nr:Ig-like domain repeat protein [Methanobrevibacter sp.]
MKLKKSHILLIVMSLFLLVSIGSVCAADNGIDTDAQLTDSGIEPIATDDGSTQEKTSTEVVSQDVRVNYNETAEIPVTVKDNSSQTIEITKENITVTEGDKAIGFNYNNSQIIITDNLAVGNHSLIINYLGNDNYANSSKTVILSVLGNLTLNAPTSVNFNSTEIVEIPVNVTNGVDLIDVTSDDFIITITNGNKTIETINGTKLIYENGKLIFTFNNTENTTFTAVIVYREDETKVLSKVLTLKKIY